MDKITAEEKEVLGEWISGVDISKIRIVTGKFADIFCCILGAQAITLGNRIFVSKNSDILTHPCMHPVRLALLIHELFHVKQEKRVGIFLYLVFYVSVAGILALLGLGRHHPCEKPAYHIEAKFLETYRAEEEAKELCKN